ncbi:hypothetical protein GEMRC1_011193 [Eukaryota sp. GEM-RC1]
MDISLEQTTRRILDVLLSEVDDMKALLLDSHTSSIISHVYSQSEVVNKKSFLFRRLAAPSTDPLPHMNAIVFITPASAKDLYAELQSPKFAEYHVFFSDDIDDDIIARVAQNDTSCLVKSLRTYFCNHISLSKSFAVSNFPLTSVDLDASTKLLTSFLLANGFGSPTIRYQSGNDNCKNIAINCYSQLRQKRHLLENVTNNFKIEVVVVDRKEDQLLL